MTGGALCRGFGTHAWTVVGPIFVLTKEAGARRIILYCERCGSWAYDTWARATGARVKARRYQHAKPYKAYLGDHTRDGARLDIMASKKERKEDGVHHPGLRLIPGRSGTPAKKASRKRRASG